MSGIAAIIHFDGRPADRSQIEAMTARMAHRGPDGISHWVEGSVALGQCMLHTTAESMDAALPLADPSGQVVLIMDGRVDNSEELKRLLTERGAQLRSKSDAELVLQAYLMFGEDCGQSLEGDYAIVIWDKRYRRVFGLRDHFAHKAFHYSWNGTSLSIATEVASILELPWIPEKLNTATLAEFLEAKWYSRDASFWSDIHRLPAAHKLACTKNGLQSSEYWRPDPWAECPIQTEEELADYYLDLFTSSVRRRSRSHLPVAYEVSGGLDSSAIFAVAVDLHRKGVLPAPDIYGYTLKYEGDRDANDLPYARSVARHLNVDVKEIAPTPQSLDWYRLRVEERRDFMGYPNGFMNFGILEEAKNNNCAVLVDGIGGDEWLSGNNRLDYADALSGRRWPAFQKVVRADLTEYGFTHVLSRFIRYGLISNLPAAVRSGLYTFSGRLTKATDGPFWVQANLYDELNELRIRSNTAPTKLRRRGQLALERMLQDPFRSWVYELNDRDASGLGIERRTPFDDKRILELTYALPLWMSRRGTMYKWFHRRSMRQHLPEDVLVRPDKATFSSALNEHTSEIAGLVLNGNTKDLSDWICHERLKAVCRIATQRQETDLDVAVRIWALWAASSIIEK